jgi:hypothetical protein
MTSPESAFSFRENSCLIFRCGLLDLASKLCSKGSGAAFAVHVFRGWPCRPCTNTMLKNIIRNLLSPRMDGAPYSAIGFGGLCRTVNPMSRTFRILGSAAEAPYRDQILEAGSGLGIPYHCESKIARSYLRTTSMRATGVGLITYDVKGKLKVWVSDAMERHRLRQGYRGPYLQKCQCSDFRFSPNHNPLSHLSYCRFMRCRAISQCSL